MMKNYFYLIFLVVFCACNNKEKAAQEELQKAQMMYENQEYFGARQVLDSIKIQYPKEFPVLKQGQLLIKKIEMAEQKRNLIYCDSLLKIRLLEIEDYKKYFIFEKDTEYEDVGTYVYKTHKIEQNLQKKYVRSAVKESGEMLVSGVYYGASPIKQTAMKVSVKNGEYVETKQVPYDGSTNYSFSDGGMTTEIVTYNKDSENGIVSFVCNRMKDAIKVTYLGKKEVSILMSENDKKAMFETYEFSSRLLEIEKLKKEIEIAQIKIEYLKDKMSAQ